MKHEAETKTNAYWLGLLAHLQSSSVPRKVKVICCLSLTQLSCFFFCFLVACSGLLY